jgi:outer membrane protein TolC
MNQTSIFKPQYMQTRKPTWAMLSSLLLMACISLAQPAPTPKVLHRISAKQAMDMALEKRIEILNAKLDIANQESYNREITGAALPQVNGTAGMQHFFNIPVSVLPDFISPSVYGVLERENVVNANGDPIKWDGVINTFPARFGVPWQASVGVSVQQLLFQPDVFIGLRARSTALELYENQLDVKEDSVKANLLKSYYGVIIAERGLQFAKESRDRLQKLYNDQEQMLKNGFIERLDLDKTKVNLINIQTTTVRLKNLVALSYNGLKFAMGIPQSDSLILTDSLSMTDLRHDLLALEAQFKYDDRPEIRTLGSSQTLLELQVKRFKLNALPTVAAFWNMQTNAQRQRFNVFDTKDRWFFSNVAGINLSVPITDGFQRRNRVKQAQISLDKNRNTIDFMKQVIDLQVVSTRTEFTNALEQLEAQMENKDLAERVFENTKLKYERGLGSTFEIIQTEIVLQDALNNYYQALYSAVVARIAHLQALGKL